MSTNILQKTNRLVAETAPILEFVEKADINKVRDETDIDWNANKILRCEPELQRLLFVMHFAEQSANGELEMTPRGKTFLGKLLLQLDETLKVGMTVDGRYVLQRLLAAGKNSLAFKAEDQRLGREVVLKFYRTGRGEGIIKNIAKLGRVKGAPVLINPLDVFNYSIACGHGRFLPVNVMVFPYVEGVTLRDYLSNERNSSPGVIQTFIEQTCIALRALQNEGLCHGDLHPNNVLVTTEADGRVAFRIIDVSYGADLPSDYEYPVDDIAGFKLILRLAIDDVQSHLTRISLRRHFGARIFTLVEYVLTTDNITFDDIYREIQNATRFTAFNEQKNQFVREKFTPPRDFGILRYEEFSNPNIALKLFCPYPELFERLCAFGSAILFGHRGTGKSTYMAAMNFFPKVDQMPVDYRENFGVLFSCRQGEFRKFSSRQLNMKAETKLQIKDILITKIIRKTLGSLAAGIASGRLENPKTVKTIADVVLTRIQHNPGIMISHQLSEMQSLKATMINAEINLIDSLFAGSSVQAQSKLLDEHSLGEFFEAVRASFSELNQTRFSVLFDDAGEPNVPKDVQSLICDLMASSNSVYCIKLSAEKKTFELLTTDGKPVERVHDVRVYTISDYFSMGGGFSSDRKNVEEYFRKLVGVRLKVCGFQSDDIRHYLGQEFMRSDELVARLVLHTRGNPVYGGWQNIWQIADRTMRHLLEMISVIFDASKITPEKPLTIVNQHIQSKQIIRFSLDKLRGLMLLPGTIDIGGKTLPLGKTLYEFAASFGKISGYYLRESPHFAVEDGGKQRFDERLGIEIDNTLNLSPDAKLMLDNLIRFAVIDDEKMVTAFDDGTRKPIYTFNCVYCPALRISFRRYSHWRLSSERFEQFLVEPAKFVRTDRQIAKLLSTENHDVPTLFD
jgi:serine/threonine protein kinase